MLGVGHAELPLLQSNCKPTGSVPSFLGPSEPAIPASVVECVSSSSGSKKLPPENHQPVVELDPRVGAPLVHRPQDRRHLGVVHGVFPQQVVLLCAGHGQAIALDERQMAVGVQAGRNAEGVS